METAKSRFLGLDLIRLWMTFAVVCAHCFSAKVAYPDGVPWYFILVEAVGIAVPVFMTMSFFLSQRHFLDGEWKWLGRRMLRLYLPFVFWAFVTFFAIRWLRLFNPPSWHSLGMHLIGGTALRCHMQMWFMGTLCWMTPIAFLLFRGFKGRLPVKTLWALAAVSIVMQYTGFNKWLFGMIPDFGIRTPAGRFFEMVPYACVGLLFAAYKDVFATLSVRRRAVIAAIAFAIYVFLRNAQVFVKPPGFSYGGLERISIAFAALAFFYFLPLDRAPRWLAVAAGRAASCTMGVYMTHNLVCTMLVRWVFPSLGVVTYSWSCAVLTFVVAWTGCFLISLIPCRFTRALVT